MDSINEDANDPLAPRMGWIAFVSTTCMIACSIGPFGVVLPALEAKFSIDRAASSLGLSLTLVVSALVAPAIGSVAARISIRALMIAGSLSAALGCAAVALSHSAVFYFLAYALLLGPALALSGQVLPALLVTRWFEVGRGRVLGLINVPVLLTAMPLMASFVLHRYGVDTVYWMAGTIMLACAAVSALVIDGPRGAHDIAAATADAAAQRDGVRIGALLSDIRFWMLILPMGLVFAGATVQSTHMFAMATQFGIDPLKAASLLSISPLAALAGAPLFGWLADRIGGRPTLGLLCLFSGLSWTVVLLQPGYPILAVLNAVIGLLSAGVLPAFGIAAGDDFGKAAFGRIYGLGMMGALAFTIPASPLAGLAFVATGSYADIIVGLAVVLGTVGSLLLLLSRIVLVPREA